MNSSAEQLAPLWLSEPAKAKYLELSKLIPNTPQQQAILAMMTDTFGDYVKAVADIRARGIVVAGSPNPAVKVKLDLAKTIVGLLGKLKIKEGNAVKKLLKGE